MLDRAIKLGRWRGACLPGPFWAVTAQALTGDLSGAVARMDTLCRMLPGLRLRG